MKKLILTLTVSAFFISYGVFSQSSSTLSSNEVSAIINGNGMLFRDFTSTNPNPSFTFKGINSSNGIFQSNLWLVAKDQNDSLFVSADMYNEGDFFEGTINKTGISSVKTFVKIDKSAIDIHKLNYATSGYIIPESIEKWPTTGDTSIGESLALAPFVDVDNNGCYEPSKGDYPFIKGDGAVYFIMNDNSKSHTSSQGSPIGLEIHVMVYYFNSTANSGINSSLMVEYELRNRSGNSYDSLFIGQFTDFDLGCASDDFIGTDSLNGAVYAYNGDAHDEDCLGVTGFGANPPAIAVGYHIEKLKSSLYFNIRSGNPATQEPKKPIDFKNYLTGTWKDGSHLLKWGSGHFGDRRSSGKTNFMYSGDPITATGWTEDSSGNQAGDRRILMAIPEKSLAKDESLSFTVLYTSGFNAANSSNYLLNIKEATDNMNAARSFLSDQTFEKKSFATQVCATTSVEETKTINENLSVYPNPSNGSIRISADVPIAMLKVYDLAGTEIIKYQNLEEVTDLNLDLDNGLYILTYEFENQSTGKQRIVIAR